MPLKKRLSVTIDPGLLAAGRVAVSQGRAENLSAWVSEALRRQMENDRRLAALDRAIGEYEAEHGVITEEEMDEATRRLRARAIVIRPSPKRRTAAGGRRRGAA
ncbi:MAG: hypothetical protein ACRDGT_00360 [Candidatus Limnocylindria bacterium]